MKIQDIISPGPDKFSLENESEITEAELLLKAEEEFSKMTLEEQVSLLFILQVDGKDSLSDFSKTRLTEIQPGGVLLFGYNISDDPGTLINFISEIKSVSGAENQPCCDSGSFEPHYVPQHCGGSAGCGESFPMETERFRRKVADLL